MPLLDSDDVIERVLFVAPRVHVYMIPPMSSGRGHVAATWTRPPAREIFANEAIQLSPRLRIVERSPLSETASNRGLTVTLLLEDPHSTELFAAAPYTAPATVMQAVDSSRFFALTVVDAGRKAVLGMGFEERSEAFDFSVALQGATRALGWDAAGNPGNGGRPAGKAATASAPQSNFKRDWSLKAGETLKVDMPKIQRPLHDEKENVKPVVKAVAMPPSGGFSGLLPPPPSAAQVKEERRRSFEATKDAERIELASMGFDDGEFGEFQ